MSEFESRSVQEIAEVMPLGNNSQIFITRMREPVATGEVPSPELLVGDILRRTCKLGGEVCAKSGCQAPEGYTDEARDCSDINLKTALDKLLPEGVEPLMVSVTKDRVGFFEEIDEYGEEGIFGWNSQEITEITGFNAFFARSTSNVALGARLADCGFIGLEFVSGDGEQVIGFMHLSRPNMQGELELKFEYDGQPVGSFEYFLRTALDYYDADINSVKVRMAAAITPANFEHRFTDETKDGEIVKTAEQNMRERFPGWYEQAMIQNLSNYEWQPGDPILPSDVWRPEYRAMIEWQVRVAGITDAQFITEDSIDPGNLELGHASNYAGAHGRMPDARDLYLVSPVRVDYEAQRQAEIQTVPAEYVAEREAADGYMSVANFEAASDVEQSASDRYNAAIERINAKYGHSS